MGGDITGARSGRVMKDMCKDPWTKPKGERIEGGRWGWMGKGKVVMGKWKQLYLKNNKKNLKKNGEGHGVQYCQMSDLI